MACRSLQKKCFMQNELARIGQIVYDLKRGKQFDPLEENFEFLEEEFRRIVMSLGSAWYHKEMGLPYLMEFHRLEAVRFLGVLAELEAFRAGMGGTIKDDAFLRRLYGELSRYLGNFVSGLDKLQSEEGLGSESSVVVN